MFAMLADGRRSALMQAFSAAMLWVVLCLIVVVFPRTVHAEEPAQDFLKRLRDAKYFDTAIAYLDRIDRYPGVSATLISAVALEKAQTYIDAAVSARNADTRDDFFQQAEQQLIAFLDHKSHPRVSEARLQLGRLQMVRAAQLMSDQSDPSKRIAARESYIKASNTFDSIVDSLRTTLKQMQGARIDPRKDPDAVARRDQYRGEFLQAMGSAGQSRLHAARSYDNPGKDGKQLLEEALVTFTELSENYGNYVQGAKALASRGQVQEDLGMNDQALDSYLRMLEQPDADPLRDAKYQATSGLVRLSMAKSPPDFEAAIQRGAPMMDGVRSDEQALPSVQELRVALGGAYLAKSADTANQKPIDIKRAATEGRKLLTQAAQGPEPTAAQATRMLATVGVDLDATVEIPEAEAPESIDDALDKAKALLSASDSLKQSLTVIGNQADTNADLEEQKSAIEKQLRDTQLIAVQTLQQGLAMVGPKSDPEVVNQARQYLAYMLYQQQYYRDAAVVGGYLARRAPGTDLGLRGGLLALNSLQMLVVEQPQNTALVRRLEALGAFLTKNWPNNPEASAAQGVMVRLALRNEDWDEAGQQIEKLPDGTERAFFQRLMGQLLWNSSIRLRQNNDPQGADELLTDAADRLASGLDAVPAGAADIAISKAALVLAKIYLKQEQSGQAFNTLKHENYGPATFLASGDVGDGGFASDVYSTQLQVLVQLMTTTDADTGLLLEQAISVMEKLRASVSGEDSQKRLSEIYIQMAGNIREQLESGNPANKAKLIEAFGVFLDRIQATTDDVATLQWVAHTLMDLAEASMAKSATKAEGTAADLLNTAVTTLQRTRQAAQGQATLSIDFQLGRAQRLLGQYKQALDTFESLLKANPRMLDAQVEAALTYEQWAAEVKPALRGRAYESALRGGRNKVIWGWGIISQQTSGNPKYEQTFFDSRYHVALCRYQWGKSTQNKALIEKSVTDITKVYALYPELGGPQQRQKYDQLLKTIQTELGQNPVGLPPLK